MPSVLATVACLVSLAAACRAADTPATQNAYVVSLAGQWTIRLDPKGAGLNERWFAGDLPAGTAEEYAKGRLPGSTDENHLGTPNHRPSDLQYLSRLFEYCGPAWYQTEIEIPEGWRQKRVTLDLEYCHWETQAWIDDHFAGANENLSTAHVHELGIGLTPGKHRLTLRIDNSIRYGLGGPHALSENTQTNWNGVVGRVAIQATDPIWIDSLQVYPDLEKKTALVALTIGNATGRAAEATIDLQAFSQSFQADAQPVADSQPTKPMGTKATVSLNANGPTAAKLVLPMGDGARCWDEFSPSIYRLTAAVSAQGFLDRRQVSFGMRKLAVEKKRLTLNGRKIFLRGTLDCCVYPKTGYPPTDVDGWLRVMRICRSYGLNHIRFHSWCPPEAAFEAADRMGFILQPEVPTSVTDWGKDKRRDAYVEGELIRILDAFGNHPSFGMLTMGNEPSGDLEVLHRFVRLAKEHDPRHLYASASGWGSGPDDDFVVTGNGRGVKGPATTYDMRNVIDAANQPVVSHEIGQWTFYPNMAEIPKYDGVLRARNFERIRDELANHALLAQAADFTRASGLLSIQLYKEEIEIMFRTPGHNGFQMLDLHDFPGQGTALAGLLDPFWDSKGLITPEQFRRFCGPTVPLARLEKRVYVAGETFKAEVDVAHFGPVDLPEAKAVWSLRDSQGQQIAAGAFSPKKSPSGELTVVGDMQTALPNVTAADRWTFNVELEGTPIANDWNLWVYPQKVDVSPGDVLVATSFDDATRRALADGRRVLLLPPRSAFGAANAIPTCFTTIFWSPVGFKQYAGNTMGLLCDPKHPALLQSPTDMHTDWQWHEPLQNSFTMVLDDLPRELRPILQVVDNFTKNRRLGLLFEAKVGRGHLLISSINLQTSLEHRPASRQLLASLLKYMQSDAFRPTVQMDADAVARWISANSAPSP